MTGAGYSRTSLVKKLGIKPGHRVRFAGAPAGYDKTLGTLPDDVTVAGSTRGTFDFIQVFTNKQADLDRRFGALKKALDVNGMLWVSWPKKSSPLAGDLDEGGVRSTGLAHGLVDVKICAVDDDWSGLKFVYRVRDR